MHDKLSWLLALPLSLEAGRIMPEGLKLLSSLIWSTIIHPGDAHQRAGESGVSVVEIKTLMIH